MRVAEVQLLAKRIYENIEKVMVGKKDVIENLLVCLMSGGHVLLEDVPGTGKTLLAKSLAASLDIRFSRVQFTPDLLPTDITGLNYYNQKQGEFVFRAGPVFTHVLLADEINRATPRTQSSLLECMEERQVTIDGVTHQLEKPFMVIATQNPVETLGTFPLPEAQLDRFLMKLSMGYPQTQEGIQILKRFQAESPLSGLLPVANGADFSQTHEIFAEVFASDDILAYIIEIVEQTRKHPEVLLGISPRGSQALLKTSQAYAALEGRSYVIPDDVKRMVNPVLSHRLITRHSGMNAGRPVSDTVLEQIICKIPVPAENNLQKGRGL